MRTPIPSILNEAVLQSTTFLPEECAKSKTKIAKRIFMVSVLLLCDDLLYSIPEVADMFDVPYNKVYSQLKRARLKVMYDRLTKDTYEQCKELIANSTSTPIGDTERDVQEGRFERRFLSKQAILKHKTS